MADPRESDSTDTERRALAEHDRALREARERFIALWGQMASSWGIPRSMAEVHALLYIAGTPMNTDEVMHDLGISRGSASMTLRALVEWGIVSRTHLRGDRKEYFKAEQDVWKLFRTILRERKKREIDPLLNALHECRDLTAKRRAASPRRKVDPAAAAIEAHNARLDSMLQFVRMIDALSEQVINSPDGRLKLAAKLLGAAS